LVSVLVGSWVNPDGGEVVEFTFDGAMIVRRDGEVLTTQQYATQEIRLGGGRLHLRTEGSDGEVVLGYHVEADVLAMSFGGQTTVYRRVAG
jgi:hypothetical protein